MKGSIATNGPFASFSPFSLSTEIMPNGGFWSRPLLARLQCSNRSTGRTRAESLDPNLVNRMRHHPGTLPGAPLCPFQIGLQQGGYLRALFKSFVRSSRMNHTIDRGAAHTSGLRIEGGLCNARIALLDVSLVYPSFTVPSYLRKSGYEPNRPSLEIHKKKSR